MPKHYKLKKEQQYYRRNNMQIEVEVMENPEGHIHLFRVGSKDIITFKMLYGNTTKSLGTTMIDIKEPKRKKLVYQWLFEEENGIFDTTRSRYGLNDKNEVRRDIISYSTLKEDGILKPLMESEKEIDV